MIDWEGRPNQSETTGWIYCMAFEKIDDQLIVVKIAELFDQRNLGQAIGMRISLRNWTYICALVDLHRIDLVKSSSLQRILIYRIKARLLTSPSYIYIAAIGSIKQYMFFYSARMPT